jgi:hypothetical protein
MVILDTGTVSKRDFVQLARTFSRLAPSRNRIGVAPITLEKNQTDFDFPIERRNSRALFLFDHGADESKARYEPPE